MLQPLTRMTDPALLVGLNTADDAAVYKINEEQAIVQTLDFFPPIVDDPYTFGAITAANALSDVYAMGGRPLFALNIAAWPDNLPLDILSEIFRGGQEKVAEAGAVVAGGHTVSDKGPKYGLCVTGIVSPSRVLTKGGARPGDLLTLTKPLGTGVITTALKAERADQAHVDEAVSSMLTLNSNATRAAIEARLNAVTDVTGFGLLGHAYEMAAAGGVGLTIKAEALPALSGALDYIAQGLKPGGLERNRAYLTGTVEGRPRCSWDDVPEQMVDLALDPQTSGGLLMAVPEAALAELVAHCSRLEQHLWVIGEVTDEAGVRLLAQHEPS